MTHDTMSSLTVEVAEPVGNRPGSPLLQHSFCSHPAVSPACYGMGPPSPPLPFLRCHISFQPGDAGGGGGG